MDRTVSPVPVRFSQAARAALEGRIADGAPPVVRIVALGGGPSGFGFSLALTATPRETDAVFSADGIDLCVDADSIDLVSGLVVDFQDAAFVFLEGGRP